MTETTRQYKVWEPLMFSVVTLLGMLAGAKFVKSEPPAEKVETAITNTNYSGRQVEEIIRFLETRYVGEVNADELVARAIREVMQGLDPHTYYFPPESADELEEKTLGHYVGIGIEVTFLGDSLVVLFPKVNSPAARAGLRPGDYIVAVDNRPLTGDSLTREQIISQIKGAKGTSVNLTVKPMMADTLRLVEITREEIIVPSVITGFMIDSSVAFIKINRFTSNTYRDFMDHWERLSTQHQARDLILDLRDNPGGFLKEAVNMLSQIMEREGQLLVYTEGKNHHRIEYKSTGKVFFPVERIAVLINHHSASASEIIAGCIQDHDRGWVIGTPSYGKGLVQEQFALSNGGVLRMTVSKYYTPSGRLIQKAYDSLSVVDTAAVFRTGSGREVRAGGGIVPDIVIDDPIQWYHTHQKRWMSIISEYAIRYNILYHGGEMASVDMIPALRAQLPGEAEITSALLNLLERRAESERDTLKDYFHAHRQALLRIAEATLLSYRTGEEGWYRAYNDSDPVVQKAREVIQQNVADWAEPN